MKVYNIYASKLITVFTKLTVIFHFYLSFIFHKRNATKKIKQIQCIRSPSYFSSLATFVYSTSVFLYETNFYYEEGHSIAHSIFKTCVQRRKDRFSLFLNTNTINQSINQSINQCISMKDSNCNLQICISINTFYFYFIYL